MKPDAWQRRQEGFDSSHYGRRVSHCFHTRAGPAGLATDVVHEVCIEVVVTRVK